MAREPFSGLPDVQQQGSAGVMEHAQATPQEFGAGVGQAEQGLGQSVAKTSDLIAANAQRLQELTNDRNANQAINGYMTAAGQEWAKYGAMGGQEAHDYYPTFQQNLSNLRDQYGASLQSPMAKQTYDDNSRFMTTRLVTQGASHAAEGLKQSFKTSYQQDFDGAVQQGVLGQNDMPSVAMGAARAADALRKNAILDGMTPEQADFEAQKGRGSYYTKVFGDMLTQPGKVGQAVQMYQTVRPNLDGNSIDLIDRMMKPVVRKQVMDGWVNGAMGGTAAGFANPNAGQIDDATAGRAKQVYDGLVKRGMDQNTALGFAASAVGESAARTNNTGDGGAAHGLFMWRNSGNDHRLDQYVNRNGHLPEQGGVDEQLDHIMWETGGREAGAAQQIAAAGNSPAEKAAAVSQFFERPQDVQLNASTRAAYANQLANRFGVPGGAGGVINPNAQKSPAEAAFPDEQAIVRKALSDFDDPYEQQQVIGAVRSRFATLNAAVAQDRAGLSNAIPQMEAQALDGHDIQIPEAQIRHVFPPEKAAELLENLGIAKAVAPQFGAVKFGTPDDVAAAEARLSSNLGLGGANPETSDLPDLEGSSEAYKMRQALLKKFQTAVNQRHAALNGPQSDPASYVASSPIIQQSLAQLGAPMPPGLSQDQQQAVATQRAEKFVQDSVSFQRGLGVSAPHVLTRADAAAEATKINSADSATADVGQMLASKAKAYGQAWPQVFGDMVSLGKLNPEYQTLAQIDSPTARSDFQRMLKTVGANPKGRESLYDSVGRAGMTSISTDLATNDALKQFAQTAQVPGIRANIDQIEQVHQAVKDLAAFYSLPGGGSTSGGGLFSHTPTSLERAANAVVGDKYAFDTSDNYLRVPKTQATLKQVQDYGDALKSGLKESDLQGGTKPTTPESLGIVNQQGNAHLNEANHDMGLTPQEQFLYNTHLSNLNGAGKVRQPNGAISSLLQTSQEHDGKFYNVPTVWDGKAHSEDEAEDHAAAVGWDKFPSYGTRDAAEARYQTMHTYMDKDVQDYLGREAQMPRVQHDIIAPIQAAGSNILGAIQRTGKWVTNESDGGAYLVAQDENGRNRMVRKADGSRVEFSWKDARGGPPPAPVGVIADVPPVVQ